MKSLIIYYSLQGNTKLIVEEIAKEIDCDILQLKLKNEIPSKGFMKFMKGGKQVVKGEQPELEPFNIDLSLYDTIIFGTPVWASSYASAFNTFFSKVSIKGKKILLFSCYAGTEGKAFDSYRSALLGNEILGQMGFRDPAKRNTEGNIKKAKEWIHKYIK